MVASFAREWGPTIAGALVGIIGVLAGLTTALLTIRAQARARAETTTIISFSSRGVAANTTYNCDRWDHKNERRRRFEDERLTAAAALSGTLMAASARLYSIRTDRADEDLDEIERLVREARDQLGRFSLLLETDLHLL